jgi:deoxycytidylate deaminase
MRQRYLAAAKKASFRSEHPTHRLGAVITKGSRVLGVGWNRYKTHPESPHPFKHLHAEIAALIQCQDEAVGAQIYIYREGKDGMPRLSLPCQSCMEALEESGIEKIHFTSDGKWCTVKVR